MTSRPCVYELAGAPGLLYRNVGSHARRDEPPTLGAGAFLAHRRRRSRAMARWYYPMDFAAVRGALPSRHLGGDGAGDAAAVAAAPPPDDETECESSVDEEDSEGNDGVSSGSGHDADGGDGHDLASDRPRILREQSLDLQREARACMLLAHPDVQDDPDERQRRHGILRQYQQYDVSYLPRKRRTAQLSETEARLTRRLDTERINFSDPAYLAPLEESIVRDLAREDFEMRFPASSLPTSNASMGGAPIRGTLRRNFVFHDIDGTDSPLRYGNCVVTVPCRCNYCRGSPEPSWCLLHATGPLLDRVRCSFLRFPGDAPVLPTQGGAPATVDIGDTLKQIEDCGTNLFIARTDLYCTIFQLTSQPSDPGLCSYKATFRILHRIDARRFNKTQPFFRPVDLACHPKYGAAWTDPNIVLLYHDAARHERKTLRHVHAGDALRESNHHISNLQTISKIEFSSHHPMVLWSIARSHVRPVLAESETSTRHPRSGHGYSLYSVDLRCGLGAFHWSPSAEEFRVEGTHSLSGIMVDWRKDHTVWVSSTSCGKTWQIDTRMPCRAVCSWSLPFLSTDTDTTLSPTGLYGAGSLLVQPANRIAAPPDPSLQYPVLAVNLDPCSSSIHLYQQPSSLGRYQTKNLEAPSSPGLTFLNGSNIAASSTFTLPDVAENVFTCGLRAIVLPTSRIISTEMLPWMGYRENELDGALFVVSTTNKGDVYSHTLLASRSSYCRSKRFKDLPVGSRSTPVPEGATGILTSLSREMFSGPGRIAVSLEQQYPCPSGAISFQDRDGPAPTEEPTMFMDEKLEVAPLIPPSTFNDTRIVAGKQGGGAVSMEEIERASNEEFENAFESFNHMAAMSRDPDIVDNRTDLTEALLQKVVAAWSELDG